MTVWKKNCAEGQSTLTSIFITDPLLPINRRKFDELHEALLGETLEVEQEDELLISTKNPPSIIFD